jgi:CRP-like cAMP-binding protein
MSPFDQANVQNLLLTAMPTEAFRLMQPHMEALELPIKFDLVESNVPTAKVCFLERGLASVVATTTDGHAIECGHVGAEGMTGAHVLLRVDRTPSQTFMQVSGNGISVPAVVLKTVVEKVPAAADLLLTYVHTMELQVAHSALANGRYTMHQRLARWLLMCHDRLEGDDLALTHEFLALMLGVRRPGVTDELHKIEGTLAIKATRGNIHIRNRNRLEEIAGACYGVPEAEYERLIGLSPRIHSQFGLGHRSDSARRSQESNAHDSESPR